MSVSSPFSFHVSSRGARLFHRRSQGRPRRCSQEVRRTRPLGTQSGDARSASGRCPGRGEI